MSYVVNKDGTYKEVSNLGWLLRHWDEVESFRVEGGQTRVIIIDEKGKRKHWSIPDEPRDYFDSVMIANLRDGRKYVTRWASYDVMLDWLHRPKFRTLPITWFSLKTTIP